MNINNITKKLIIIMIMVSCVNTVDNEPDNSTALTNQETDVSNNDNISVNNTNQDNESNINGNNNQTDTVTDNKSIDFGGDVNVDNQSSNNGTLIDNISEADNDSISENTTDLDSENNSIDNVSVNNDNLSENLTSYNPVDFSGFYYFDYVSTVGPGQIIISQDNSTEIVVISNDELEEIAHFSSIILGTENTPISEYMGIDFETHILIGYIQNDLSENGDKVKVTNLNKYEDFIIVSVFIEKFIYVYDSCNSTVAIEQPLSTTTSNVDNSHIVKVEKAIVSNGNGTIMPIEFNIKRKETEVSCE